jgi:hypothetical protein
MPSALVNWWRWCKSHVGTGLPTTSHPPNTGIFYCPKEGLETNIMAVQTRSFKLQSLQNSFSKQDAINELEHKLDRLSDNNIIVTAIEIFTQFPEGSDEYEQMGKQIVKRKLQWAFEKISLRLPKTRLG